MADSADSTPTPADKAYDAWTDCQNAYARFTLAAHAEMMDIPESVEAANAALHAYGKALDGFMFYPVDSPAMLQHKLEWFIADACEEHPRANEFLAIMVADAQRIDRTYFEVCQKAEKAEKRAALLSLALDDALAVKADAA